MRKERIVWIVLSSVLFSLLAGIMIYLGVTGFFNKKEDPTPDENQAIILQLQDKVLSLQEEIKEFQASDKAQKENLQQLNEDLAEKDKQIAKCQRDLTEKQNKIDEVTQEKANLQAEYDAKVLQLQESETENAELSSEVESLSNQLTAKNTELDSLQQSYNNKLEEIAALQQEKEDMQDTISALQTQINQNQTLITSLQSQLQTLQNEVTRLTGLLEGYEEIKQGTVAVDFYDDENNIIKTVVSTKGQTLATDKIPVVENTEFKEFRAWSQDLTTYVFTEDTTIIAQYNYYAIPTFKYTFVNYTTGQTETVTKEKTKVLLSGPPKVESFALSEVSTPLDDLYNVSKYTIRVPGPGGQTGVHEIDIENYWQNRSDVMNNRLNIEVVLERKPLNDISWDVIQQCSAAISNNKEEVIALFGVGEEKTFTMTNGDNVTVVILGLNQDKYTYYPDPDNQQINLEKTAGITFGLKNLLRMPKYMNNTTTNVGGWESSYMRTWLNQDLYAILPSDLKAVVLAVDKTTEKTNTESVQYTTDKLWLLSETEFTGQSMGVTGTQYTYYKTHGYAKKMNNGTGDVSEYWLRTPHTVGSSRFNTITSTGGIANSTAANAFGVCFGFCV